MIYNFAIANFLLASPTFEIYGLENSNHFCAAGTPADSGAARTPADSSLKLILQLILNADSLVDEAERYESDQIPQMDRKSAPHVLGELRKRVSAAEGPVIDLVKKLSQLVPRMQDDSPKSQNIRRTVYGIEDRFRRVSQAETAAVSKALSSALTEPELKMELAEMMKWCELAEKEASQNVNSLDGDGLEKLDGRLAQFTKELQEK